MSVIKKIANLAFTPTPPLNRLYFTETTLEANLKQITLAVSTSA